MVSYTFHLPSLLELSILFIILPFVSIAAFVYLLYLAIKNRNKPLKAAETVGLTTLAYFIFRSIYIAIRFYALSLSAIVADMAQAEDVTAWGNIATIILNSLNLWDMANILNLALWVASLLLLLLLLFKYLRSKAKRVVP